MLDLIQVNIFEGPNIYGPHSGVAVQVRSDFDYSARFKAALKDAAQAAGLMLAYLTIAVEPTVEGLVLRSHFVTEAPQLGADLVRYVVRGVNAELTHEEWDADTPLLELQERQRVEALPVATVQLMAEARARDIPVSRLANGDVLFGYGVHSWQLDRQRSQATPPWAQIARIPIYAVTGDCDRRPAIQQLLVEMEQAGIVAVTCDGADRAVTQALLANRRVSALIVGLDTTDILQGGIAFDCCDLAVIVGRGTHRPPAAVDDSEWLRALGVPMLVARQPARLKLADHDLHPLVAYAPDGVIDWQE
jgi:hypothetical protein